MPQRLRIVTPRFGAQVVGGAEKIARDLALQLVARGWHVEAWTTTALDEQTWKSQLEAGTSDDEGIEVRRFAPKLRRHPRFFREGSRLFFRLPSWGRAETPWIMAQGPYAPALVRALSAVNDDMPTLFIPYLFYPTLRGVSVSTHPRLMIPAAHDERPFRLRAVTHVIDGLDALWYSTPEERQLVESTHPGARALPHAIGTVGVSAPPDLDPAGFRGRHDITGKTLYYGGRTSAGKGFDLLLDGFAQLRVTRPDVHLMLSGEAGKTTPEGAGVIALGHLSDAERWQAIAAADVVVVPSRVESLSLLALEAWACGRPCIVNADSPVLCGQAERSGGALPFTNAAELARAADNLLGDDGLAWRLGRSGRDYVSATYGWDAVVTRLEGLIKDTTS